MTNRLKEIATGFSSLLTGMRITLGQFFRSDVTVQYPHESLRMPARYRGHLELVADEETGKSVCVACKLCERACPSDCIVVEGEKREGERRRVVPEYRLDFTKCSLCAACVEACNSAAIRFSKEYNLAGTSKDEYLMDLLKRLEVQHPEIPAKTVAPAVEPPATTTAADGGRTAEGAAPSEETKVEAR